MKRTFLIITILFVSIMLNAQIKGVVIDQVTGSPIANVMIYAQNNDNILSTASNENGEFIIDFSFNSLFFSHINYEKIELKKANLKNTVELFPNSTITMLEEVVASAKYKQPAWIEKKLKEIVKQKTKNYQTAETQFAYNFKTTTLDDGNGYTFKSQGNLLVPKYSNAEGYKINPQKNIILFKDTTAGMDFHQFRRLIYNDFLPNFNNSFVKKYRFNRNFNYETENKNIIKLSFTQEKYNDDFGYIVIDTAKNVILEFERNSGLRVNVQNNIASIGKTTEKLQGFVRNIWDTYTYGKFEFVNGSYQLVECKYQMHMKNTQKGNVYIFHIEAFLNLSKTENTKPSGKWLVFTRPLYSGIYTKKMREEDEALQKVTKIHEKF